METVNGATIQKAGPGDLLLLHSLCRSAYSESFANHWNEGGLEWYLEKTFGLQRMREDLDTPAINYFIAYEGDEPVGFMKLKISSPVGGGDPRETMEVEKLYCRLNHKGKGHGKRMMQMAISLARELHKKYLRLEVLDTNYPSITFYKNAGFHPHITHRLNLPYFKEELKGLLVMELAL